MKVLQFTNYGKSKIKEFNLSPDAFVQMAFQLTYYKIYGNKFLNKNHLNLKEKYVLNMNLLKLKNIIMEEQKY